MSTCTINFHVNKTHLSEFLENHPEYTLEECQSDRDHYHLLKIIRIGEIKT